MVQVPGTDLVMVLLNTSPPVRVNLILQLHRGHAGFYIAPRSLSGEPQDNPDDDSILLKFSPEVSLEGLRLGLRNKGCSVEGWKFAV